MKKIFLIAAVVGFGLVANAQKTDPKVEPIKDWAHCDKQDYPLVAGFEEFKKLSETEKEVVFRVRAIVASCTNNKFAIVSVNPKYVWFTVSGDGSEETYVATPTSTTVTMTFDKEEVFEDGPQHYYTMNFYPWGAYKQYFAWGLVLTQNPSGTTSLKIK